MTETTTAQAPRPPAYPLERRCPLEPAAEYTRLRAEEPISKVTLPTGQVAWLVTSHADMRTLLADNRMSADRGHPDFPLRAPVGQQLRKGFGDISKALIGLDLPEHSGPRRMVVTEFTVRRINELRPRIQQIVDERIDAMLAKGPEADLVAELALPVPSSVICELLGVPLDRRAFFQERTQILLRISSTADERLTAADELRQFMDGLVTAKEREPGDDLLGRLIVRNNDTGVFTHELLVGMAQLLLIAGHETTSNMIALGTIGLLQRPEAVAELQADPELVGRTVEEMLRYYPIIDGLARLAKADIEIGGVTIRAGDGVVLAIGSGNRDQAGFADAERFDVHRGARHHVSFGYGIHQCLGQNLARTELEIVFGTLLRRIPNLRLAAEVDDLPFKDTAAINGVYRLPVTW
jgi:cytochrome P450